VEIIISKRSFYGFYVNLFAWCCFYFLLTCATLGTFWQLDNSSAFESRNYGLIPLAVLILSGAIHTIFVYIKNAPSIEINKEAIKFNHSSTYFWKDLEKIELTGKRRYLFWTDKEGVSLKFKDQKERIFLDKMYANFAEIKSFIENKIIQTEPVEIVRIDKVEPSDLSSEHFIYYKGYQIFCFEGLTLWIFNLFFLYGIVAIFLYPNPKQMVLMPIGGMVLWLGFFSTRLYYFGLSENFLVVRNHNFFWIRKFCRMEDIREIVFERANKMPTTLRIIKKDFASKAYPAATISNKKWVQLKDELEKRNITVKNECGVSYETFRFKLFDD